MAAVRQTTVSSPALRPSLSTRLPLALAGLAIAAAVVDILGIAGYRRGAATVTIGLAILGGSLTLLLTRRSGIAAIVGVVAVLLAGILVSRAPWSSGRLESELDGLQHLDGFVVIDTQHAGHSWCRPHCPSVTRTWRAPDTSPRATVVLMTLALSRAGLAPPYDQLPRNLLTEHVAVRGSRTNALVTARRDRPGDLRVTVVLTSH